MAYAADIFQKQEAARKQRADSEFLNRPGPTGLGSGSYGDKPPKQYGPDPAEVAKFKQAAGQGGIKGVIMGAPYLSYKVGEKIQPPIDKTRDFLSKKSAMYEGQASTKRAAGKSGILTAAAAGGVSIASGAVGFFGAAAHPVKTSKSIVYTVKHPVETGARAGEALSTRPVQSTFETIGGAAAAYGTAKLLSAGATKVIQTGRKMQPVKSSQVGDTKVYTKTKQYPTIDVIDEGGKTYQKTKFNVEIGKHKYTVRSKTTSKIYKGTEGHVIDTGKTKHTLTEISPKGKTRQLQGVSRHQIRAKGDADKVAGVTVSKTSVKVSKNKYATADQLGEFKGAKVAQVDQKLQVSQPKGKHVKTLSKMPRETWQTKTKTVTRKIGTSKKPQTKIPKTKTFISQQDLKTVRKKTPSSVQVGIQTRIKGKEVQRQLINQPKTPPRASYTETWKAKTQVIPSTPKRVLKYKAVQAKRIAGRAGAKIIDSTDEASRVTHKMMTTKKAGSGLQQQVNKLRFEKRGSLQTSVLQQPKTIKVPKGKIQHPAVPQSVVLIEQARTAARLSYIYRPIKINLDIPAGILGAAVVPVTKVTPITEQPPITRRYTIPGPAEKTHTTPYQEKKPAQELPPFPIVNVPPTIITTTSTTYKPPPGLPTTTTPPPITIPGLPGTPAPPFVPGVPLPSLPPAGGFDSFGLTRRTKSKQPKGYTPSATALAFSIKGKASKAGTKTGFGLRPIIVPKKKKKLKF